MDRFEIEEDRNRTGHNPMFQGKSGFTDVVPSAPVAYEAIMTPTIMVDAVLYDSVEERNRGNGRSGRELNPMPDSEEQEYLTMSGRIGNQKLENLVAMNNMNLLRGGDKNMPLGPLDNQKFLAEKAALDKAIKESHLYSPKEVQEFDPNEQLGASKLDGVNYETTNYSLPVSHGVGEEYTFGSSLDKTEYKSMYEK